MIKADVKTKDLYVKHSTLPDSGHGLFTRVDIPKGSLVAEYKGKITTWKDARHEDGRNAYIYYINRNHVIDARPYKKSLARYANDAKGFQTIKGIRNNAEYIEKGKQVFIKATRNIPAGTEIFVSYGKEYWDVMKDLKKQEMKAKK